jgi:hypothetical protein
MLCLSKSQTSQMTHNHMSPITINLAMCCLNINWRTIQTGNARSSVTCVSNHLSKVSDFLFSTSVQTGNWDHPASVKIGTWALSWEYNSHGTAMTTYSHLAPRLEISRAKPTSPPVAAWNVMGRQLSLCEQSELPVVKVTNQKCHQLPTMDSMLDISTKYHQSIKFLS